MFSKSLKNRQCRLRFTNALDPSRITRENFKSAFGALLKIASSSFLNHSFRKNKHIIVKSTRWQLVNSNSFSSFRTWIRHLTDACTLRFEKYERRFENSKTHFIPSENASNRKQLENSIIVEQPVFQKWNRRPGTPTYPVFRGSPSNERVYKTNGISHVAVVRDTNLGNSRGWGGKKIVFFR